ncbi:hypothetical protein BDK51DRAFT_33798 [Blyttiomyces helicus]|uniref:Uncharacterized protein n=1 Tax=Blyttiomyces helicus TaxID=388810 RepID=A0A4P9WS02_9FUNG|nr:hypothetical protein BDK51DRAFT_33798 [Blyttiomyces helicus]|eukprot:RKO94080.1 hypothetical protein BDK51DRAFT_33798 [Blyttiomyces helicus]
MSKFEHDVADFFLRVSSWAQVADGFGLGGILGFDGFAEAVDAFGFIVLDVFEDQPCPLVFEDDPHALLDAFRLVVNSLAEVVDAFGLGLEEVVDVFGLVVDRQDSLAEVVDAGKVDLDIRIDEIEAALERLVENIFGGFYFDIRIDQIKAVLVRLVANIVGGFYFDIGMDKIEAALVRLVATSWVGSIVMT